MCHLPNMEGMEYTDTSLCPHTSEPIASDFGLLHLEYGDDDTDKGDQGYDVASDEVTAHPTTSIVVVAPLQQSLALAATPASAPGTASASELLLGTGRSVLARTS